MNHSRNIIICLLGTLLFTTLGGCKTSGEAQSSEKATSQQQIDPRSLASALWDEQVLATHLVSNKTDASVIAFYNIGLSLPEARTKNKARTYDDLMMTLSYAWTHAALENPDLRELIPKAFEHNSQSFSTYFGLPDYLSSQLSAMAVINQEFRNNRILLASLYDVWTLFSQPGSLSLIDGFALFVSQPLINLAKAKADSNLRSRALFIIEKVLIPNLKRFWTAKLVRCGYDPMACALGSYQAMSVAATYAYSSYPGLLKYADSVIPGEVRLDSQANAPNLNYIGELAGILGI